MGWLAAWLLCEVPSRNQGANKGRQDPTSQTNNMANILANDIINEMANNMANILANNMTDETVNNIENILDTI